VLNLGRAFSCTDILGALSLASQIFSQLSSAEDRRTLVLFSDMRNHTCDLDMELPPAVSTSNCIRKTFGVDPTDLPHVQVYALGVDGSGRSTAYWQSLEKFWNDYFRKSGATLGGFSALRELSANAVH
jgi:hypothetical protein